MLFHSKSGGDEKTLLSKAEDSQTSKSQVTKTSSVRIMPYESPSQDYNYQISC